MFWDSVHEEAVSTVNQSNIWRVSRSFANDFLELKASSSAAGGLNLSTQTAYTNVRTVDVLFSLGSDNGNGTAFAGNGANGDAAGGVYLWYPPGRTLNVGSAGAWWWGRANASGEVTNSDVMLLTVVIQESGYPIIFLNGEIRSALSKKTSALSGSRILTYNVGQNTTHALPMRIGSIRLYDRVLTSDEIRRNVQFEIGTGRLTV